MADVSVTKDIAAPPEKVWSLISDVTRMGDWSPETTSCSWKGGAAGPAVGAKFAGDNVNGSKKWTTTCRVTESEPGKAFAFESIAGPMKIALWDYQIEATATGSRVTESWTDERSWISKKISPLVSGVSDRNEHNRQSMQATLDAVAAAAEAS